MKSAAIDHALLSLEGLSIGDAWTTVSALGDRDTTCAIAAGIAAMRLGWKGIPVAWREALPAW